LNDGILHLRLRPDQAQQFQPLLNLRSSGKGSIYAVVGESFDRSTGEIVLELHASVIPWNDATAICRKIRKLANGNGS
jgi:hypothetical protein